MEKVISREINENGVYIDGKLWRALPIDPKFFSSLRPFVGIVRDLEREHCRRIQGKEEEWPYSEDISVDEWIKAIINNVRCYNSEWSDAFMAANPERVISAYRV